jgi:hypothetical protein
VAITPGAALRRALRLIEQGNAKQAFPFAGPGPARWGAALMQSLTVPGQSG